jgi:hypothetical protein
MVFKKCIGCKREYTKKEFDEIKTQQRKSKKRPSKNACPDCSNPLKTYDEFRFNKKWYGYISNDKRMVEHLVLVEFHYYDDCSFEIKVPLLNLAFETKDFLHAINNADKNISIYLKEQYEKVYNNEHKFLTQAYINETIPEKQDVLVWW